MTFPREPGVSCARYCAAVLGLDLDGALGDLLDRIDPPTAWLDAVERMARRGLVVELVLYVC